MGIKEPLSQSPIYYCDHCWHIFEEGEDQYKDEEGNDMCETCWHLENNHGICDECGEWIEDTEKSLYDEEDDLVYCNEDCQIAYYSAWLSQQANL